MTCNDYGVINAEVLFSEFTLELGLPITDGSCWETSKKCTQIAKMYASARTKTSNHKH